jgi:magnesium-transporting ATPase (P-type)
VPADGPPSGRPSAPDGGARPPALILVAAVVTAQGAALLAWGLYELAALQGDQASNRDVAVGSMAYFLTLAVLVLLIALGLWSRRRWLYGAAVFIELIALGLTWEMLTEQFWLGAVLAGGTALAALAALFSPSGREAFGRGNTASSL